MRKAFGAIPPSASGMLDDYDGTSVRFVLTHTVWNVGLILRDVRAAALNLRETMR